MNTVNKISAELKRQWATREITSMDWGHPDLLMVSVEGYIDIFELARAIDGDAPQRIESTIFAP